MDVKKSLLLIMRHAKSDPNFLAGVDFDRPLNEIGQQQPKIIAKQLNAQKITLDMAVISPSLRTSQTWDLLRSNLNHPPNFQFDHRLYNASREDMSKVILDYAPAFRSLLILAHCPAVMEMVRFLSGENLDFKTSSLAMLSPLHGEIKDCLQKPYQFHLEKMITAHE